MKNNQHGRQSTYRFSHIGTKIDGTWVADRFNNKVKDTCIIEHEITFPDSDLERKMNFIQISSFVWIFADKEHQLKIASVYTSSTFEIPLNQKLTFTEALSVIKKSAQEFKAQFKKVTEDTIFSGVDVIESSGAMGNVAARLVQYIQ